MHDRNPAMNRWAIDGRPRGLERSAGLRPAAAALVQECLSFRGTCSASDGLRLTEPRSGEKRWRATAVQDAGAWAEDSRIARSVLECPPPRSNATEDSRQPSGAWVQRGG